MYRPPLRRALSGMDENLGVSVDQRWQRGTLRGSAGCKFECCGLCSQYVCVLKFEWTDSLCIGFFFGWFKASGLEYISLGHLMRILAA